jgi:hypothetical protein
VPRLRSRQEEAVKWVHIAASNSAAAAMRNPVACHKQGRASRRRRQGPLLV